MEPETPRANILIVDDNSRNLLSITAILENDGYNLVEARSGAQALKCLIDQEFAVVLLDVVMPLMDGFEVAKIIRSREKTRTLPIIFLTGVSTDERSVFGGYSVGAVDYLLTPVVPEVLRTKVSVFVDLFRKSEKLKRQAKALTEMERIAHEKALISERQRHELEMLRVKEEYLERERDIEAENARTLGNQKLLLERSNAELERFAHIVSHDLQEPLNTLTAYCQVLEQELSEKLEGKPMEYLRFILSATQRMRSLVQDLLMYSRLDTRTDELKEINVNDVVMRTLEDLQATINKHGAEVHVETLPSVFCDEVRLSQVFQNLVSNAIKFRGTETPRIHISAEREDNFWKFCVEDNGIGIEPTFYNQIFAIFNRLHSSDRYEGTGIGLTTCKKIIESYGGRIWVESIPQCGSRFYFTLPAEYHPMVDPAPATR
jgi:signal transduction histidine kinase